MAALQEFLKRIQDYYGLHYNPTMLQDVERWASRLNNNQLKGVYKNVTENFPSRYGKLPDISAMKSALDLYHEEAGTFVNDLASLPDPDLEERKRTLTTEEREMGAVFMSKLLGGISAGRHPADIYEEWVEENADWVGEKIGDIQDVVRGLREEFPESSRGNSVRGLQGEEGEG